MQYIQYGDFGEILCVGSCPDSADLSNLGSVITVGSIVGVGSETHYVQNGELVPFPEKPSPYHAWDWPTKSWLPNLDAAREAKLQSVATELNARLYLPCNGFDADDTARSRISGTIARLQRGDGLPAGWVGWRDASNEQHWAADDAATVLNHLTALSRAIEDREQSLLVAAWQHKKNLEGLEDIDAIVNYDLTLGWPA